MGWVRDAGARASGERSRDGLVPSCLRLCRGLAWHGLIVGCTFPNDRRLAWDLERGSGRVCSLTSEDGLVG